MVAKGKNSSFCLLPWGKSFREGGMLEFSDAEIAVLPVIAIHADNKQKAYPGYERICALAKVSKATVAKGIDGLADKGLIAKTTSLTGAQSYNEYRLLFSYDKNNDDKSYTRQWIALHRELFEYGIWGEMPPKKRRVYLILKAFAWSGLSSTEFGYNGAEFVEVYERKKWRTLPLSNIQFLSGSAHSAAEFARLAGVADRTYRDAKAWLIDNSLIIPHSEGKIDGFVIPFWPKAYFRDVVAAIKKAKEESARHRNMGSTGGARRSMGAALRRLNPVPKKVPLAKRLQSDGGGE